MKPKSLTARSSFEIKLDILVVLSLIALTTWIAALIQRL